jgi:uncharacterized protein Yka (UPF0111/DUF47 family)
LERYRDQLTKIEKAAEGIKIPIPAIQSAVSVFFEKMSKIVDTLEKSAEKFKGKKKKAPKLEHDYDYIEWLINKPQADKIVEHLRLLEDYIEKRNSLRNPIDRFLSLVNGFLGQSDKKVTVAGTANFQ